MNHHRLLFVIFAFVFGAMFQPAIGMEHMRDDSTSLLTGEVGVSSILELLPVSEQSQNDLTCAICLEEMDPACCSVERGVQHFKCAFGHVLCKTCLEKLCTTAFDQHQCLLRCPQCRSLATREHVLLQQAFDGGDIRPIASFIERGGSIEQRDEQQRTLLMRAVRHGYLAMTKSLLQWGAQVDACDTDGMTSLMWAVHHQQNALINVLLEYGANACAHDNAGRTVLMYCAIGDVNTLGNLVVWGADIDAQDADGSTLLMYAARCNRDDVVRYLLSRGAQYSLRDNHGRGASDYARSNHHEELACLIDDYAAARAC